MSETVDRFIEEFGDELIESLKLDDADWIDNQYLEEEDSGELFFYVDVRSKGGIYKMRLEAGPLFSKYWDDEDVPRFVVEHLRDVDVNTVAQRMRKKGIIG